MKKLFGIFILFFFFLSCSSDLDFDQVNDLKLEPVFVANMASFDIIANQFVIGGVEQPIVGDVMDFDVFNDEDFSRNINKTDLFFEFNNTINRAYIINLYFLDANDVRLYSIPFVIPAYSGSTIEVTKTEVFDNAKLDLLKKTQKIAFFIAMLPGPPLTDSSIGSLKMRSSATLYFLVQ
ncbi:MAG TPA: hypothetical protein PLD18_10765 [Flavobacterium sp.]|nr:hypothetical protein [Flavobacterium sp.]